MTLRTYIILAVVALVIVGLWLCPAATAVLLWICLAFGFIYGIGRLFWAVVRRLER